MISSKKHKKSTNTVKNIITNLYGTHLHLLPSTLFWNNKPFHQSFFTVLAIITAGIAISSLLEMGIRCWSGVRGGKQLLKP